MGVGWLPGPGGARRANRARRARRASLGGCWRARGLSPLGMEGWRAGPPHHPLTPLAAGPWEPSLLWLARPRDIHRLTGLHPWQALLQPGEGRVSGQVRWPSNYTDNPILDTQFSVLYMYVCPVVEACGTPLDSETGSTGDFWSHTDVLKQQN